MSLCWLRQIDWEIFGSKVFLRLGIAFSTPFKAQIVFLIIMCLKETNHAIKLKGKEVNLKDASLKQAEKPEDPSKKHNFIQSYFHF